jgi:hypothetical protein
MSSVKPFRVEPLDQVVVAGIWKRIESVEGHTRAVRRNVEQALWIPLTDEEKARLAEDMVETHAADLQLDAEKKEWLAEWKHRKEVVASRRAKKIAAVQTGREERVVDAVEYFDHDQRMHYFVANVGGEAMVFHERPMKEQEFLVGQPTLFADTPAEEEGPTVTEVRPESIEATLVASSSDEEGTKVTKRGKRLQPVAPGMTPSVGSELAEVMREERSVKGKVDHVTD